ncbi:MAG: TonB-dependent receptor, partial [Bacteroidales bacterium]|nr:TonB-dependent receptor [Bacteroidales bacterium]
GSGWTYGVGSRTMVMMDGMPINSPEIGDVNWSLIPMENIAQVEVMKGASSVLYGSSALNGLINVRTARPGIVPETRISSYLGIYGDPENEDYIWWSKNYWKEEQYPVTPFLRRNVLYGIRNPIYTGTDISHSRRIGNWDLTAGLDLYTDEGYRQNNYERRVRFSGNATYHDRKIEGMNYGFNVNAMSYENSAFFIWKSADEAYTPSVMSNLGRENSIFYIDPFFNYIHPKNNTSHNFRSRFYISSIKLSPNPEPKNILETFSDMGLSFNSVQDGLAYITNNVNFADLIQMYANENYAGLIDEIGLIGEQFFPEATQSDLMDVIYWAMNYNAEQKIESLDKTYNFFTDYQFHKQLETAKFTAGATYQHMNTNNSSMGTAIHNSDNIALFFQWDQKFWEKLNISAGVRFEYYRVDTAYKEATTKIFGEEIPIKPVLRGGLNYEIAQYTFLRASIGQGYRYPSIAEKFLYRDIGGVAGYPNPSLVPESGWSAEIGLKQGFKLGNISGFFDAAGFYTRYKDMIEFQFGLFDKSTYAFIEDLSTVDLNNAGLGVRFMNVSNAQIYGADVNVNGLYEITPSSKLTFSLGYVFINPIDMDWEDKIEQTSSSQFDLKEKSNDSKFLKYRQKHSVKGTIDFQYRHFMLGTNLEYKSKTEAVDYFMVDERVKENEDLMDKIRNIVFPGLHDYWISNNKGYFAMDFRIGIEITKNLTLWAVADNLLNSEYSLRPMDVSAPRTFLLKLNAKF